MARPTARWELVDRRGLLGVAGPERADLALDDERAHAADEPRGALVGLLVGRVVADHAVEGREHVAHLVERGVHRVRPGELAVVAQALGAPVGEDVAAEGGEHVRAAAVAEDAHRRVEPLVPGGDELRVVDAAVGGLGRLLVGEDEPVGQVVVRGVDHGGQVVERTFRAGAQVEVLVVHGCRVVVGVGKGILAQRRGPPQSRRRGSPCFRWRGRAWRGRSRTTPPSGRGP